MVFLLLLLLLSQEKTVIQVLNPSSQNQVYIIPKSPNSLTTPPIYTHIPINPYIPKTYHTSPYMDEPPPPPTCLFQPQLPQYHTAPTPLPSIDGRRHSAL